MKMRLISATAVLCGLAAQAQAVVVFEDGFAGNSAAAWTMFGENVASWAAADQKLQSSLSATAHNPGGPGFGAIIGLATSAHFKIEGDVQVIGAVPDRGNDFGHVGFFWGYQGPASYSVGYLRTHSDHVTAWQSPYSAELITSLASGSTTNAADVNGVSYHLSFEVDYTAQTLTVSLGGVTQVFGPSAFTTANSAGGVGGQLGVISWGEHVSYDNVKVTDFTVSSVPEPAGVALWAAGIGLLGVAARRRGSKTARH